MAVKKSIYYVGGCVRDALLGRPSKDIDYVVVGSTPEAMLAEDFIQVGKDFPVYLKDGDEYALARTERKTGEGYHGFVTDHNPNITLREDLERRDLTINSLAVHIDDWEEFQKTLNRDLVIDYFSGLNDLDYGILRHTSGAFVEDPVRVLRVARFASRYDFRIADDTITLMKMLSGKDEFSALTHERVYAEFEKALMEDYPVLFLQILDEVGAAQKLFPELVSDDILPVLRTVSLERAKLLDVDLTSRMMIITAGLKPPHAVAMLERLKAPNKIIQAVKMSTLMVRKTLSVYFDEGHPQQFKDALDAVGAWRNVDTFKKVMAMFVLFDNHRLPVMGFVWLEGLKIGNVAKFALLTEEQKQNLKGAEIQQAISEMRLDKIKKWLHE